MSGLYPDVPAPKIAYDRDGTIGQRVAAGVPYSIPDYVLQKCNDELIDRTNPVASGEYFVLIFPELRDIVALFLVGVDNSGDRMGEIQTSVDTTNGVDGTWDVQINPITSIWPSNQIRPYYRQEYDVGVTLGWTDSIYGLPWEGIKGIKIGPTSNNNAIEKVHFYGQLASGESPDRLRLWHPTLDEEVGAAYFDWEEVSQDTVQDRDFRVKNNSLTLTANDVFLWNEVLRENSDPPFSDALSLLSDVIRDVFHRTNGALGSAETGQAWVADIGTFVITDELVYPATYGSVSWGATSTAMAHIDLGSAEQRVEINMFPPTNDGMGIFGRMSDTNNFWFAMFYFDSGARRVYAGKVVAGALSFTLISDFAFENTQAIPSPEEYLLTLWMRGNDIEVYVNNLLVASVTDSFNNTATKVGMFAYASPDSAVSRFTAQSPVFSSLDPEEISSVQTIVNRAQEDSPLSLQIGRIVASAESWS